MENNNMAITRILCVSYSLMSLNVEPL